MERKTYKIQGVLVWASLVALQAKAYAEPYTWNSVTIKGNGFIDGIVYGKAAPGQLFIHTDMGGAYRWNGQQNRWNCLTDWAAFNDESAKNFGTETLAIDPTDGRNVFLSVGTYMSPTAVLRSSDGGLTWARINVPFRSNGNGSARNAGERMVVDPNAPETLYYGTRADGLWKTSDRTSTWTRVNTFPTTGLQEGWGKNTGLIFVQIDAASGKPGTASPLIYVGVFDTQADAPRLYRSNDAGLSWSALPGKQFAGENTFPQRMAITPDGKTAYITYGTSKTYPGPYGLSHGRVFKITDPAGASPRWTDITPPAQCSFSAITIDPADPSTVYAGEINDYNPADRIWRSTDSGVTWKAIHPNDHRDDSSAPYAKNSRVHWLGDLQIDPFDRNTALFTTGYGMYRTINLTADEPTWTFFNEGFEQSAVSELVSPTSGTVHLISAILDRDGYRHDDFLSSPSLGCLGQNTGLSRGSTHSLAVAALDNRAFVRTVNAAPFVQFSSDNAITWHWMPDTQAIAKSGGLATISADAQSIVWNSRNGTVYFSRRQAESWSPWKEAVFDSSVPKELRLVADPVQANTVYGIAGSKTYVSNDGGGTWKTVTTQAPEGLRWIRVVNGHPGHLWAGGGGEVGLWRSTDGGANWTRVNKSAVSVAYVVGVGAARSAAKYPSIFIGGKVNETAGVFRSDDEGQTWTAITDPQHQYGYLTVIQGDPRIFGRVYLGTNGRGIVYGDIK